MTDRSASSALPAPRALPEGETSKAALSTTHVACRLLTDERSDILHRHELIHVTTSGDAGSSRRKRACTECARARERCTKGAPCTRCSTKSLQCIYPQELSDKRPAPPRELITAGQTQTDGAPEHAQEQLESPSQFVPTMTSPVAASPVSQEEPSSFTTPTAPGPLQPTTGIKSGTDPYSEEGTTVDCSMAIGLTSPLEAPGLVAGLYEQPDFMTTNSYFGYHQPVGYHPPVSSPASWIPTSEPAVAGYDPALDLTMASYAQRQDSLQLNTYAPNLMSMHDFAMSPAEMQSESYLPQLSPNQPDGPLAQIPVASPIGSMTPISQSPVDAVMPGTTFMDVTEPLQPNFDSNGAIQPSAADTDTRFHGLEYFSFPSLESAPYGEHLNMSSAAKIREKTYKTILHNFQRLCLNPGGGYQVYLSSDFPGRSHMEYFMHLYFQHFNPILPVIHERLADLNTFWPLTLAMCAIGCQYANTPLLSQCATPLHEFLRRAVAMERNMARQSQVSIPLTQTLILSQISLLYNGSPNTVMMARAEHRSLVEILESFGFLRDRPDAVAPLAADDEGLEGQWLAWLMDETKRRIVYSIWVLSPGFHTFQHSTD